MTEEELTDERQKRVLALFEDCVRTELRVTDGMLNLELSDQAIESLMEGVTSGVLNGFAVDWSPKWVKPGQVHHWEDSGRHFARCGVCLSDSPPSATASEAAAWAHEHEASH